MADDADLRFHHHQHLLLLTPPPPPPPPRPRQPARQRVVDLQGGHIVRATGRKDRHSKVCTAKGPRDRRVRLSAHTAIQFYDVQDRLGYDRPSKAVDWLIKQAKSAIDELTHLPPCCPPFPDPTLQVPQDRKSTFKYHEQGHAFAIVPPSLASDAIADTVNLFFPVSHSAASPNVVDLPRQEDLRLSLLPHGSSSHPAPEQPLFSQGWMNEQSPGVVPSWGSVGGGGYNSFLAAETKQRCPLQSNGSGQFFRGWMDVAVAAPYPPGFAPLPCKDPGGGAAAPT